MKRRRPRLRLGRAARGGLRVGTMILTATATVKLATLGWTALENRIGAPGGELLILPLIFLLFYTGWTARREYVSYKIAARQGRR